MNAVGEGHGWVQESERGSGDTVLATGSEGTREGQGEVQMEHGKAMSMIIMAKAWCFLSMVRLRGNQGYCEITVNQLETKNTAQHSVFCFFLQMVHITRLSKWP